jgi:hypothetical protein
MAFDDELAAIDNLQEIEFMAGPLDGHSELISVPLPMAVCFKSEAVLKRTPWLMRISQLLSRKFSRPFHVAIYELALHQEQLVYRYTESIVASEQKRQSGKVWLRFDRVDSSTDFSNRE